MKTVIVRQRRGLWLPWLPSNEAGPGIRIHYAPTWPVSVAHNDTRVSFDLGTSGKIEGQLTIDVER
jgi:hypothetical protein